MQLGTNLDGYPTLVDLRCVYSGTSWPLPCITDAFEFLLHSNTNMSQLLMARMIVSLTDAPSTTLCSATKTETAPCTCSTYVRSFVE